MSEVVYNVSEAAYILGVSELVILKAIRERELNAFWGEADENFPGRGYRLTISALEEFMHKHQTKQSISKIGRVQERRMNSDYLETLDEREERLFDEICFIEKAKEYLRGIGL